MHFPRWNRTADELCVTEIAQVIWAVQMSTVEFHPWNSRRADTESPDEWRIDLDPGDACDYATVRRVAHVAHEVLDELGATGFPKTSGGSGMHVYVRIRPDHGFKDVRRAALAFAREVERRTDDVTTTWWRKDRDPTKLFVDYNQNARDHTIAAAYSVRGNPEATVSTPIRWDEVDDAEPAGPHHRHGAGALRRARRPARRARRRGLRHRPAAGVGGPRRARRGGDPGSARGALDGQAVPGEVVTKRRLTVVDVPLLGEQADAAGRLDVVPVVVDEQHPVRGRAEPVQDGAEVAGVRLGDAELVGVEGRVEEIGVREGLLHVPAAVLVLVGRQAAADAAARAATERRPGSRRPARW